MIMFREKFQMRKLFALTVIFVMFASCNDDDDRISYPHTEKGIVNLGFRGGLTSNSSDEAFLNALNEVLQDWLARNPSPDDFVFDGITYEFTNLQVSTGAIPNSTWDSFWAKLNQFSFGIGSCWAFSEVMIPSRGGTGTALVIYAIVTQEDRGLGGEVLYVAVRGNVRPKSNSARSASFGNFDELTEMLSTAEFKRKSAE
jgi:hypothetical protein